MSFLKKIFHRYQYLLKINNLSETEKLGKFSKASIFKFFKRSSLEVPFILGRTIRGSSFDNANSDPMIRCLKDQDLLNFDVHKFSSKLQNIYVEQQFKKVNEFLNIKNPKIKNLPSWTIAYPWERLSFQDLQKNYLSLLERNRKITFHQMI